MDTGMDRTPPRPPHPPSQRDTANRREALADHYPAITETAEHLLRALVGRHTLESRCAALGVWQLWSALTVGYQNDGDTDRLERLLDITQETKA